MTDQEILQIYRDGQQERAFNEIVRNYSERLYWHVRALVLSHDDADDLMQEIFIKIWTALPSFRGDAQLFTWLYRIATNEALNFMRKTRLKRMLSFGTITPDVERTRADDPYFDGKKAEALLLKAVAKLPDKQRTVFMMRYHEDLKYEEISDILDTSVGALKASYHIAYEKVKKALEGEFQ